MKLPTTLWPTMPRRTTSRRLRTALVLALVGLAACNSDAATPGSDAVGPTFPSPRTTTTVAFPTPQPTIGRAQWSVDTARCDDADAANAPITSPLVIGMVAPQTGGLVSAIYAPVVQGFQAYIAEANADEVLGDTMLDLVVADDEGKAELTPVAVSGLLAADAQVVSGIIGTANNLAVRGILNLACVPQVMALSDSPKLADVANAPWTIGAFVPLGVETTVYANSIVRTLGESATIATIATNDEDGAAYVSSLVRAVGDTKLAIVAQQTIEPGIIDAPTKQVLALASTQPDAIVASLSGAACATFLTTLAQATASLPDWKPAVYMSSDCSDSSLLGLAGPAADGVLTSANIASTDADFVAAMAAAGVVDGLELAAEGWTAAEVTVAMIAQAQQSAAGLTRASIIDAARNLSFTPSLARPGVHYTTNGTDDPYLAESLQIVRFDAASRSFVDVGDLIAQFES